MANSAMVSFVAKSPNHSGRRNHAIDTITPHYMAGNLSVEACGRIFAPSSRQASSNYGIGSDGSVGLYVDEANRAWTSSSRTNDNRAVTIECANFADGSLSAACWASLVALCADICRRNGKTRLVYRGAPSWTGLGGGDCLLTMHKWFADTSCPGPWLSRQFERLASEVNAKLGVKATPVAQARPRNNAGGGKLDVDGDGGYNTIFDLQAALGTRRDGVVSDQRRSNRKHFPAISAVDFGPGGSDVVRAMQRRTGADVDGDWGPETSTKMQRHLIGRGFSCGPSGDDGYFGPDSTRALQRCLNAGRL